VTSLALTVLPTLLLLSVSAFASSHAEHVVEPKKPEAAHAPEASHETPHQKKKAESKPIEVHAEATTGWETFQALLDGNQRFVQGKARHEHADADRRHEVVAGQKPHTIVLSCSDSRVPPELIFDQGLGDVFTIRLAGHVLNPEAIASIEYAVEHLGSKLLVIMGHESCGAVKAALTLPVGKSAGSASLDQLVAEVRANMPSATGRKPASADPLFREPVKAHVVATALQLVNQSEIVREKVRRRELLVAEGIYSLASGKVEFWDVGERYLTPLTMRKPASSVD
jgi:carbonic anhydrase